MARPCEQVQERFLDDSSWLATWAGRRITRPVRVVLRPASDRGDALIVPLAWEVTGLRSLIPSLEGDVEIAPPGRDHCRITLSARYVPPFGELGVRVDHAVMHHVAASTLHSLVARVAASIQAQD